MDNMQVYLGVWTNWSRGAVMGATLTTTREYGNFLIAFTAFFIPFVATRFWRICCFFLHRIHSTAKPKGALHHQRQVLLRNAASMESALVTLFSLIKSWHARKHANPYTLLPLFGLTILIIVAFTVAGGFSSRISSGMSDEVLINGNNCGIAGYAVGSSMDLWEAGSEYIARGYTDASNYVQQCYSDDSSGILGCDRFIVKKLDTATIETNRSCPFSGDICQSNDKNIRIDSGYIDSHDHLGLNTPPNERIGYRHVLECAPLKTEGHVRYVNMSNITWAQYSYGSQKSGPTNDIVYLDYTYEVPDLSYQYSKDYKGPGIGDFLLSNFEYQVVAGEIIPDRSDFMPIPELVRTDGDVALVFLSGNGVMFYEPVDDDWYRATAKLNKGMTNFDQGEHQPYAPTEAASPLACVEQWQWCNSSYHDGSGCGPLASGVDSLLGAAHLFNLSEDVWYADRPSSNTSTGTQFLWPALIGSVGDESVSYAILMLKYSALASRSSSFTGIQYGLSNNQWHLDVQRWWDTMQAKTQANMVNAAIGHTDPRLRNGSWMPVNQYEQDLCNNQKIRSTNYTSFSLFGLYFTYITGALIVLISFILEPIFGCLHNRTRYKQYKHLEWTTNETLQLHRLAHEGAGSQSWSGCTNSAPTTLAEASLASLDIEDLTHPILARPAKIDHEKIEVARNSLKIDLGTQFQLNLTDGNTAVHVNNTSEESTEDNASDNVSRYSSNNTIGYFDEQDSLQRTLPMAHSLSSDHAANSETTIDPIQHEASSTECRDDFFRQ